MENISTLEKILIRLSMVLLLFISMKGSAQPDYSFSGATLLSGTNLQVGALYRFSNVRPGIDARMSISSMSPGIGLTELDGASGYPATIQPTITAQPWTNGYVELTIQFVNGGTTTPMVQPQLAFTAFDVDGVTNFDGLGHNLYEFDQVDMGGGYADFNTVGGELSVTQSGNWFTGTNISATDYPGRDTASQQVMFSIINVNVTTVVIRVGVNNQTNAAASRLRCVYFKKFNFVNSILAMHSPVRMKRAAKPASDPTVFSVRPSVVTGTASIAVTADKDGWANFELIDYSGRSVLKQQLMVNKGVNNIPFFGSGKINSGNYVAILKMDGDTYHCKIIRQ